MMNENKHHSTGYADVAATPGALIIGGAQVSLGLARSLGRKRVPVWVLTDHPIAKFSRYVQRSFVVGSRSPKKLFIAAGALRKG
jgi:hypothetical protein